MRFLTLALALSLAACATTDDVLIVPGERVGDIAAHSTEAELRAAYGDDRVVAAEVSLGEGYVCHGAKIDFGNDQSLAVIWQDTDAKAGITEVQVDGDRWRTKSGVHWGMTLKEVEQLNGGPFTLSGFGWDYGGTVGSWEGGRLDETLPDEDNNLWLRFFPPRERFNELSAEEQRAVSGDKTIGSDHPVVQKLDPYISDVRVVFSHQGCDFFFAG